MNTAIYALQEAENLLQSKIKESARKYKQIDAIACESESTGLGGDLFGSGLQKIFPQQIGQEGKIQQTDQQAIESRKMNDIDRAKRGRKSQKIQMSNCPQEFCDSNKLSNNQIENEPYASPSRSIVTLNSMKERVLQQFSQKIRESSGSQKKNFTTTTDRYTDPAFVARLQMCLAFEETSLTIDNKNSSQDVRKPKSANIVFFHKRITRTARRTIRPTYYEGQLDDLEHLDNARYRYADPQICKLIRGIYDKIPTASSLRRQTAVVGVAPIFRRSTSAYNDLVAGLRKNFQSRRVTVLQ